MSKLKVAVLFGGCSSEHEVSLVSATSVIENLSQSLYEVIPIGITKNGHWIYYPGPIENIASGSWSDNLDCCPAVISPDSTHKGILKLMPDGSYSLLKIDCVFPVLHGKNGEDGTIQGLLELAGIPYVGCDVLSSAACMDKSMTHIVLESAQVKCAKWERILRSELSEIDKKCDEIADSLSFPIFVKPARAGSSVGINKATDEGSLRESIILAFTHDDKVICEEAIAGKEVECAVLGNGSPSASIVGEIVPAGDFYDYDAKYINDSKLIIPADIDKSVASQIQSYATQAYKIMDCSGLARVDFFVTKYNEVYLNEINTMPGFTSISMYPKLWEKSGIPYSKLLQELIEYAVEKNQG